jgi:hypothetical protein
LRRGLLRVREARTAAGNAASSDIAEPHEPRSGLPGAQAYPTRWTPVGAKSRGETQNLPSVCVLHPLDHNTRLFLDSLNHRPLPSPHFRQPSPVSSPGRTTHLRKKDDRPASAPSARLLV